MRPTGRDLSARPRSRVRRKVTFILTLAAVSIACVACSGNNSASPGVASIGSTTTTTAALGTATPSPFAGPQQAYQYDLAYAECMRSHGVPSFPDPKITTTARSQGITFNQGADSSAPQYATANNACKHLLPNNGGQPTAAQLTTLAGQLLKFAQCVRSHGEPNFPDPVVNAGEIGFSLNGIDPNSPQYQRAQSACKSLNPIGGG